MTKFRDFLNESKLKDRKGNTLRVGDWVSYGNEDYEIVNISRKDIELKLKSTSDTGRKGSTMVIPIGVSDQLEQIDRPH